MCRLLGYLVAPTAVAGLLAAWASCAGGVALAEKIMTQLAQPAGLVWLALIGCLATALRRPSGNTRDTASAPRPDSQSGLVGAPQSRRAPRKWMTWCSSGAAPWPTRGLVLVLVLYTAGASSLLGDGMLAWLEGTYEPVDIVHVKPFDLVVVLGGGTKVSRDGSLQLDWSGDRVMLGARLYLSGKAAQLATTGSTYSWNSPVHKHVDRTQPPRPGTDGQPLGTTSYAHAAGVRAPADSDPTRQGTALADDTQRMWRQLGIPAQAIIRLPGRNTTEEMQSLKRLLAQRGDSRVGLVTSAWHMSRALRLARREGLVLVPCPAHFETGGADPLVKRVTPSDDGFRKTGCAVKEYLAWVVGR